MLDCPRCLLFNSFDPGGFVSLDKPPVAIWLQVLSAKLIGFNGLAMLLPQVVEGLLAVVIVYLIVQRRFGLLAGSLAALLLAITPSVVAVDRSNNMESCLILVLLGAAWGALRAAETGKTIPLLVAMGLLGVGFNVKMGAALALAPVLISVYIFAGGQDGFSRRLAASVLAGVVLVIVSLSWVMLYDLTPSSERPYVGSTSGNSMLELAALHNGLNRFIARLTPAAGGQGAAPDSSSNGIAASDTGRGQRARIFDDSPTGVLRLFRPQEAAQAAWWLPMGIAGALLGWLSPGAAGIRGKRALVVICGGWVAAYWMAFSFAGGVVHFYYLAVLGPPLAVLVAIGASEFLARWQRSGERAVTLAAVVCITVLWQAYLVIGQAGADAHSRIVRLEAADAAVALAMGAILAVKKRSLQGIPFGLKTAFGAALAALVVMPAACALSVVLVRPNPSIPIATLAAYEQPPSAGRRGRGNDNAAGAAKLLSYLLEQRQGERYLVAVPSSRVAAPLIIASGLPVIAMGGFAGRDPILTPEKLQHLIEARQVRFVMIVDSRRWTGTEASQHAINDWVRAHGKPVDPAVWQLAPEPLSESSARANGRRRDATQELFDLRAAVLPAAIRSDG
jgi:4-amino-4-deoxy-L-arabinose transferase-like glycosyltransferase